MMLELDCQHQSSSIYSPVILGIGLRPQTPALTLALGVVTLTFVALLTSLPFSQILSIDQERMQGYFSQL